MLKKKKCKCSPDCSLWPTLGFGGYNYNHAPQEIKDKKNEKKKQKPKPIFGIDKAQKLKLADKLFGDFIKKRDSDKFGQVKCPCCNNLYSMNDRTGDNQAVVQILHFVSRTNYQYRYSEDFCYAGCCYCNLNNYLDAKGKEYQNYKNMLVQKLGLAEVEKAERSKYDVNKLPESYLDEIIEKYELRFSPFKQPLHNNNSFQYRGKDI